MSDEVIFGCISCEIHCKTQCPVRVWPSFCRVLFASCSCDVSAVEVSSSRLVTKPTGRHVWNLCPRYEWGGAAAEQRALVERTGTPVLSERLLCRAEQVSAEQLSPSLQVNTLWIISIYLQGHISIKVIAPFCSLILSALFSFPPVLRAPFRASALPSSCHQLACLLRRSFNQTAQWLGQTHWLSCVPALSPVAHSGICQHINALKCCLPPFCTSPLLIPPRPPSQEVLRQVLIRSDRSAQTQDEGAVVFHYYFLCSQTADIWKGSSLNSF